MSSTQTIAIIIASTRGTRLGPHIASLVQDSILLHTNNTSSTTTTTKNTPTLTFDLLDLASNPLPLFDEPTIPAYHPASNPTPHYHQPHTRAWSAKIQAYSAFIFVTPQYNWSVPAGLKNALDYLYHEWKGKPAGIVSYGGHGGDKAAGHLRQILGALKLRVVSTEVRVSVPKETMAGFVESGKVDGEGLRKGWGEAEGEEKVGKMVVEIGRELENVD